MELLFLDGQIKTDSAKLVAQFRKPINIESIQVLSISSGSPPYYIPKRPYAFRILDKVYTVPNNYFPSLKDMLANVEKNVPELKLFVTELADKQFITAFYQGRLILLECELGLASLFGNNANVGGWAVISCGRERVYLLRRAVVPGTVHVNLLQTNKKNVSTVDMYGTGSQQKLRIGTIAASYLPLQFRAFGKMEEATKLEQAVQEVCLEIVWADKLPYVPQNENISVTLGFIRF